MALQCKASKEEIGRTYETRNIRASAGRSTFPKVSASCHAADVVNGGGVADCVAHRTTRHPDARRLFEHHVRSARRQSVGRWNISTAVNSRRILHFRLVKRVEVDLDATEVGAGQAP